MIALTWGRGRKEAGRKQQENSSFNMAANKEREWIRLTWAPQPGSPYLPFPLFLILVYQPPLFRIANQPMCLFTGEVEDKEKCVGHISNLSMLFISIYLFYSWHLFISLSLHECMVSCLCTYECDRISACNSDKDGLLVCVWSSSRDGWIQKIFASQKKLYVWACVCVCVCVCVCERISVQCVVAWLWIHKRLKSERVEASRLNLLKKETLFEFGLSQQAIIDEPWVPGGRWTPRDHRVIHRMQIDMETALGCQAQGWWREQDKAYKCTHID